MTDSKENESRPNNIHWLFLTNQMNLKMILASGLFMPREGFGDKYYTDLLNEYPGWIPLFPNTVPRKLVDRVVSEAPHLKPVAVELDISGLRGTVRTLPAIGPFQEISLPDGQIDTAEILLVPAPLPLSLVKKIFFATMSDKKDFIKRARSQYRNVPEVWFSKGVGKKWFAGRSERTPDRITHRETVPGALRRAQAVGGMFTLLFHLANRSDKVSRYYQWLTGTVESSQAIDPILTFLRAWLRQKPPLSADSIQVSLFWIIVNDIISTQAKDLYRDVVLESTRREIRKLEGRNRDQYREKLDRLCDDLQDLRGLSDDTLDDLFNRHTRTFSRALILFFLMNTGRELLSFAHEALTPDDFLAAAILFGAREGWIDQAVDLRHGKPFADGIALRMAGVCHRVAASGLTFTAPVAPVLPLRTVLSDSGNNHQQRKRIDTAMLDIARQQKWDCIETTIRLPKGQYQLVVEQSNTKLILDGDIKTIQARVRQNMFWDSMSQLPLPLPDSLERLARETVE